MVRAWAAPESARRARVVNMTKNVQEQEGEIASVSLVVV